MFIEHWPQMQFFMPQGRVYWRTLEELSELIRVQVFDHDVVHHVELGRLSLQPIEMDFICRELKLLLDKAPAHHCDDRKRGLYSASMAMLGEDGRGPDSIVPLTPNSWALTRPDVFEVYLNADRTKGLVAEVRPGSTMRLIES